MSSHILNFNFCFLVLYLIAKLQMSAVHILSYHVVSQMETHRLNLQPKHFNYSFQAVFNNAKIPFSKDESFHRRKRWYKSFCPTRLLLDRGAENVSKRVPQNWSPRARCKNKFSLREVTKAEVFL